MTTHNWTIRESIRPNTEIIDFPNGRSVQHYKDINKAYHLDEDLNPVGEPIDTSEISVDEWEETLLGIEKL